MAYLIFTRDRSDGKPIRDANRAEHYAYLQAHQHRLIASGGVQGENGQFIGGAIILDVDTLDEAKAFVDADPFSRAGLFEDVIVARWAQAFLDGRQKARE